MDRPNKPSFFKKCLNAKTFKLAFTGKNNEGIKGFLKKFKLSRPKPKIQTNSKHSNKTNIKNIAEQQLTKEQKKNLIVPKASIDKDDVKCSLKELVDENENPINEKTTALHDIIDLPESETKSKINQGLLSSLAPRPVGVVVPLSLITTCSNIKTQEYRNSLIMPNPIQNSLQQLLEEEEKAHVVVNQIPSKRKRVGIDIRQVWSNDKKDENEDTIFESEDEPIHNLTFKDKAKISKKTIIDDKDEDNEEEENKEMNIRHLSKRTLSSKPGRFCLRLDTDLLTNDNANNNNFSKFNAGLNSDQKKVDQQESQKTVFGNPPLLKAPKLSDYGIVGNLQKDEISKPIDDAKEKDNKLELKKDNVPESFFKEKREEEQKLQLIEKNKKSENKEEIANIGTKKESSLADFKIPKEEGKKKDIDIFSQIKPPKEPITKIPKIETVPGEKTIAEQIDMPKLSEIKKKEDLKEETKEQLKPTELNTPKFEKETKLSFGQLAPKIEVNFETKTKDKSNQMFQQPKESKIEEKENELITNKAKDIIEKKEEIIKPKESSITNIGSTTASTNTEKNLSTKKENEESIKENKENSIDINKPEVDLINTTESKQSEKQPAFSWTTQKDVKFSSVSNANAFTNFKKPETASIPPKPVFEQFKPNTVGIGGFNFGSQQKKEEPTKKSTQDEALEKEKIDKFATNTIKFMQAEQKDLTVSNINDKNPTKPEEKKETENAMSTSSFSMSTSSFNLQSSSGFNLKSTKENDNNTLEKTEFSLDASDFTKTKTNPLPDFQTNQFIPINDNVNNNSNKVNNFKENIKSTISDGFKIVPDNEKLQTSESKKPEVSNFMQENTIPPFKPSFVISETNKNSGPSDFNFNTNITNVNTNNKAQFNPVPTFGNFNSNNTNNTNNNNAMQGFNVNSNQTTNTNTNTVNSGYGFQTTDKQNTQFTFGNLNNSMSNSTNNQFGQLNTGFQSNMNVDTKGKFDFGNNFSFGNNSNVNTANINTNTNTNNNVGFNFGAKPDFSFGNSNNAGFTKPATNNFTFNTSGFNNTAGFSNNQGNQFDKIAGKYGI